MKNKSEISGEVFNQFLLWLDQDVEEAGKKYLLLRKGVVAIFKARACADPESLADEVMDRVARKLSEGVEVQNTTAYIRKVAHLRYLEYQRDVASRIQPIEDQDWPSENPSQTIEESSDTTTRHECLERCFGELFPNEKDLILRYYHSEKRLRIDYRSQLARELGIGGASLRVRAHRIRLKLEACINGCVKKS